MNTHWSNISDIWYILNTSTDMGPRVWVIRFASVNGIPKIGGSGAEWDGPVTAI